MKPIEKALKAWAWERQKETIPKVVLEHQQAQASAVPRSTVTAKQ